MNIITVAELHARLQAQGVKRREDFALVCPMCRTVQTGQDLIDAGAGATFDEVEKYLGFSCIGRFTGAPTPRIEPDGKPCNWTLGGLFQTHELEILADDGTTSPIFEPATPEQAQAKAAATRARHTELEAA